MGFSELIKEKKDKKRVASIVTDLFNTKDDVTRQMMERVWWLHLLYYVGEHWVEYMRSTRSFRRKLLPPGAMTPVSNEIRDYVRSQKAMLLNQKYIPKIFPNTNEREDKDAAEFGEKVLLWMDSINDYEIEDEMEKVAIWTILAGTGFARTFPDKEAGAIFRTPSGTILHTGEVITENVTPFDVHLDTMGDKLRMKRWIGIQSLKPREWVEDTFKVKVGKAEMTSALDYQRRLTTLVGQVNIWKGDGIFQGTSINEDQTDLVVYKEIEIRPTKDFPEGRYVAVCQDQCLVDVERMPIKVENGNWFYSLTDFHWNYVPGRFYSDSGVADLISPQNIINQIDKASHDNRITIGRPRVLSPGELTLKRLTEKGESFLVIQYDPLTSRGQKPEFQPGTPNPPEFFKEREIAKAQIQDSAGNPKNILKGMPPSASSSGVQVDILTQTAEKEHYPDVERFNRSRMKVWKKRLLMAKELYTEERMVKFTGKGGSSQVRAFKGADLRDNTDVRIELDSGISTTKAGKNQILMEDAKAGFLGDIINDPEIRTELLKRQGLSGFGARESVDIARAEAENSAIIQGDISNIMLADIGQGEINPITGQPEDEVLNLDQLFKYDNHTIHYQVHRKEILGDEFRFLEEKAKTVLINHTDLHHKQMMEEMQAQAMAQAQAAMGQEGQSKKPNQENQGAQANG